MFARLADEHADLALRCDPVFGDSRPLTHWRGMKFEHASHIKRLTADNTLYEKFSESKLYHVEVLHAGMGPNKEVRCQKMMSNDVKNHTLMCQKNDRMTWNTLEFDIERCCVFFL